jgi:hypothetical protein
VAGSRLRLDPVRRRARFPSSPSVFLMTQRRGLHALASGGLAIALLNFGLGAAGCSADSEASLSHDGVAACAFQIFWGTNLKVARKAGQTQISADVRKWLKPRSGPKTVHIATTANIQHARQWIAAGRESDRVLVVVPRKTPQFPSFMVGGDTGKVARAANTEIPCPAAP